MMQMKIIQILLLFGAFLSTLTTYATPLFSAAVKENNISSTVEENINEKFNSLANQTHNLNPAVLKLALTAYFNARTKGLDNQQILTVIDYTKRDTEKRLWVLDLKRNAVKFNTLVAHGKNTDNSGYAQRFSNNKGSRKSSIGLFSTANTYYGSRGLSLRLKGLDRGFNDNAYNRSIVMHGASYVNETIARTQGRVGHSWGCPALSPAVARPLINTIKNGTLVFAYASDSRWLSHSSWLSSSRVSIV